MFIVPKKIRGIEKGTFVVLKKSIREDANINVDLDENKHLYFNKYIELLYVVDSDFMKCGEFVECIPVVFDSRKHNQKQIMSVIGKNAKTYAFSSNNLQPMLYNISDYVSLRMDNPMWFNFKYAVNEINHRYRHVLKQRNVPTINHAL